MGFPFALRRTFLLTRDLLVDRDRPNLEKLSRIEDPEKFVWAILPHAARTFSACIALLPGPITKAAAVGYLYCRMLDTYEDLIGDHEEREEALRRFAERFGGPENADGAEHAGGPGRSDRPERTDDHMNTPLATAPRISSNLARDQRDASHLLLVERHGLVDRAFCTLDSRERNLIRRLVSDMSEGMRWSSATFARQGGVLEDDEQLARYCLCVLGHPVLFASRLLHYYECGEPELPVEIERDAVTVGEMVYFANVTRDIEKDLQHGVAYDPLLRDDLGASVADDPELVERVRSVRERILLLALQRAPAYRRLVEFLSPRRLSLGRASAVLMFLFTDRYFRSCARRAGRPAWGGRRSGISLILTALPAAWSRRWSTRMLSGIERDFLRAAAVA